MDITSRRDSFLNITPLCVFFVVIMMSACSSNATTNLLLTGETLGKNSKLGYPDSKVSLKLGGDCNLVLFNDKGDNVWESDTVHYSIPWPECTLSFTNNGRLVLNGTWLLGEFSWITPNADSKVGKYVAVLHPEGKLSIYGPRVWAVGDGQDGVSSSNNGNEMVSSMINLKNSPTAYNVLFSGQELHDNDKLTDGGYSFIMTECELLLQSMSGDVSWRTWTRNNGRNCFARLNHSAELVILDGAYATVWSNELGEDALPGEYVLVMQQNGNVVIYGPEVWSTAHADSGLIKMRTTQK